MRRSFDVAQHIVGRLRLHFLISNQRGIAAGARCTPALPRDHEPARLRTEHNRAFENPFVFADAGRLRKGELDAGQRIAVIGRDASPQKQRSQAVFGLGTRDHRWP